MSLVAAVDGYCAGNDDELAAVRAAAPACGGLQHLLRDVMGPYLSHTDRVIRTRAVSLLAALLDTDDSSVLSAAPPPSAAAAASAATSTSSVPDLPGAVETAAALVAFFQHRLADYPCVLPCLQALRALLSRHTRYLAPDAAVAVTSTLFKALHVPAMEQPLRQAALGLLLDVVSQPTHVAAIRAAGGAAAFGTGFVQAMDAEKDPRCLVVALRAAQATCRALVDDIAAQDGGDGVVDELFDVTACYFPVTFTPPPGDRHGITQDMLVQALRGVLTCTPRFMPLLVPLVLEKLSSAVPTAKAEAMATLCAALAAHGAAPMQHSLREVWDAVRAEAVCGSDTDVTDAVLRAVTALAAATSRLTATTASPAWPNAVSAVLEPCASEVGRAADTLIGRASGRVLAAVAAASDFTLVETVAVLRPVVDAMFADADRGAKWPAVVAVVADVLEAVDPSVAYAGGGHPLAPHAAPLHDVLASTLTSPGCDASLAVTCQAAAARGLTALATRPTPCLLPEDTARQLVERLVELWRAAPLPLPAGGVLQGACVAGLQALARRPALRPVVLSVALPMLAPGLDDPATTQAYVGVLTRLCVSAVVFQAVVPLLLRRAVATGGTGVTVAATASAGAMLVALADLASQHGGDADAMGACVAAADGDASPRLLPALLSAVCHTPPTAAHYPDLVRSTEAVVRHTAMGAPPEVSAAVRGGVVAMFLGGAVPEALGLPPTPPSFQPFEWSPTPVTILAAAVGCGPSGSSAVADAVAVCKPLVDCVLRGGGRGGDAGVPAAAPVAPPAAPTTAAGAGAVATGAASADATAPDDTVVAAAKCLGALLNRLPRGEGRTAAAAAVITNGVLPVGVAADGATPTPHARVRAVEGLVWAVKGLVMAGHWSAPVPDAMAALLHLVRTPPASPALLPVCMRAAAGFHTLMADVPGTLSRGVGATVKAVYRQRLFAAVVPPLVADQLPGALPPPVLLAVCGVAAGLPSTVLVSEAARLLPVVLVSVASPDVRVRVSALSTLRLLVSDAVQLLVPHLSSVVKQLLRLTTLQPRAVVRAEAIACLAALTRLPYPQLAPLRSAVVRGLAPALDDAKRAVRRRAAACRNEWITLSTALY